MALKLEQKKTKSWDAGVRSLIIDMEGVCKKYRITDFEICDAIGIDPRTYWRWRKSQTDNPWTLSMVNERWTRFKEFLKATEDALPSAYISEWLHTRNKHLLGFSPIKCVSTPEGLERVLTLVHAFRWGLP